MQAHVRAAADSDIHFARSLSDMGYGRSSVPMTATSRFLSADDAEDDPTGHTHANSDHQRRKEEAEAAANRENPTRTAISLSKPLLCERRGVYCTTVRFSREMPFLGGLARSLEGLDALTTTSGGGVTGVSASSTTTAEAPMLVAVACLEASFGPRYPLEPCEWRLLSPIESQPYVREPDSSDGGELGGGEASGSSSGYTVSLGITADEVGQYITASAAATVPASSLSISSSGPAAARHGAGHALNPSAVAGDNHTDGGDGGEVPEPPSPDSSVVAEREYVHVLVHPGVAARLLHWLPEETSTRRASGLARSQERTGSTSPSSAADGGRRDQVREGPLDKDSRSSSRSSTSDEDSEDKETASSWPTSFLRDFVRLVRGWVSLELDIFALQGVPDVVAGRAEDCHEDITPHEAGQYSPAASPGPEPHVSSAGLPSAVLLAHPRTPAAVAHEGTQEARHSTVIATPTTTMATTGGDALLAGVDLYAGPYAAHSPQRHEMAAAAAPARSHRFCAVLLPQGGFVAWGQPACMRSARVSQSTDAIALSLPLSSGHTLEHQPRGTHEAEGDGSGEQVGVDAVPWAAPSPRLAYPSWVYEFYVAAAAEARSSCRLLQTTKTTGEASQSQHSSPRAPSLQPQLPPTPPSSLQGVWPWPDWFTGVESAAAGWAQSGTGTEEVEPGPVVTAKILLTSCFYTDGGLLPTMLREPASVLGTHRRSCRWADINLTVEGEAHLALHAASKLCKALHLDMVAHLLSTLRRLAKAIATTYHSLRASLSHRQDTRRRRGVGVASAASNHEESRDRDGEALNAYVHEMIGPVLRETVRVLQDAHQPFWAGVAVCCLMLPCLLRDGSRSDRDGASSAAAYSHAFGPATAGSVEDVDVVAPFLHHAGIFGDYVSVVSLVERVLALVGQETKRCEARIVRRALERALYARVRPRASAVLASSVDASVDLYLRMQRLKSSYPHPMTARHAPIHACAVCGLSLLDRSVSVGFDAVGDTVRHVPATHAVGGGGGGGGGEEETNEGGGDASSASAVVVGVRSGMKHVEETAPEGCLVLQCIRCGHGGHVEHLIAWWADPDVRGCPKGCACECVY